MTLRGMAQFKRNLDAAMERYKKAIAAGCYGEASNIVSDAVVEAPIDTGSLRRSGYVTDPYITKHGCGVEFGFGGIAEQYALQVHETHATRSQYLRRPMNKAKAGAKKNVEAIAKAVFASGDTSVKRQTASDEKGSWAIGRTPDEAPRNRGGK